MSNPIVAVVGRPNVGKSTLVNRFLGRQEAIVEEKPGVTRDRKQVDIDWAGRSFTMIDTGGWLSTKDTLSSKVSEQSERATKNADLILFIVDAATGAVEEDEYAAQWVRKTGVPIMLLVNKVDTELRENDVWDFARLGLGDPWAFSALHGRNSGDVLDQILRMLPDAPEAVIKEKRKIRDEPRIAIVGRPNVGKSTLVQLHGRRRARRCARHARHHS